MTETSYKKRKGKYKQCEAQELQPLFSHSALVEYKWQIQFAQEHSWKMFFSDVFKKKQEKNDAF